MNNYNVNQSTERLFTTDERIAIWTKRLIELGHSPKTVSVGSNTELDYFAFSVMGHNGPTCIKCGMKWCWHCIEPEELLPCINQQIEFNF